MKIYRSIKKMKKPRPGSVVAIGVFDGIHRGHAHIIKNLVKRARRIGAKSMVLTFYPHPYSVLHPKGIVPLLVSVKHRLRLLADLGVDILVLTKFSLRFSYTKAEEFVSRILLKRLGMKEMLVGENFSFGKAGSGDIALLKNLSRKYGFKVKSIALLKEGKRAISSTYVRSLILNGRLKEASRLLGRPVSILGTVIEGAKRGRILGYPTANVNPHHEAIPPSGVYAVYVKLGDKRYRGVLNIGFRPTFHPLHYAPEPTIEVHIFNFRKNIYGKDIEIIFIKRMRPERRFKTKAALIRKIMLDEGTATRIFRTKRGI